MKTMYICSAIAVLLLITAYKVSYSTNEIDKYLTENGFQGSVLVAKGGKVLFSKGYGFANEEHQIPNKTQTVFRLGSISKLFTAVAILQLQDKGFLNVNDPVAKYIPDYPQGDRITIHHLLSHSSGIPSIYHFSNLLEIQRQATTPLEAMRHFKNLPLKFAPGTDTDSTDSGYIILGAIIEIVTQGTYEDYLKEHIFRPLDMNATYYEHNKYVIPNRASGYYSEGGKYYHAPFIDMSLPHAAGALSSTVEDLYKFDRAVRGNAALFRIYGFNPDRKIAAGYGYRIGPLNRGMEGCQPDIVGHFATIDGFEGAMISYLEEDLTIILLSNVQKTDVREFHKKIASYWRQRA